MSETPRVRAGRPLMTDAQGVAKLLGVDVTSIFQRLQAGHLPAPLVFDGDERWRIAEIRAWVKDGCPDRKTWEARMYRRR